jgi:drug/metabolite transporter (DMT)-like permease
MQRLTRQQLAILVALTLVWGVNWPVMKIGVSQFPALSFRAWSILLGLPVLAAVLLLLKLPFRVPRRHWRELFWLTLTNMLVWHICIILAVRNLSSGRAAILGYTMPIFSAVIGAIVFSGALSARAWAGVGAAALGVALLLWHEFTGMAGHPAGVALALFAACVWAFGTQLLRRSPIELPTLTLSFWMTAITGLALSLLAAVFERDQWHRPSFEVVSAVAYNGLLIFGFAQAAWFHLARTLPPVASTLSVMFIPVLAVFSGALWLGEVLHWQDWAAVALMMAAIGSVLWRPGHFGRGVHETPHIP